MLAADSRRTSIVVVHTFDCGSSPCATPPQRAQAPVQTNRPIGPSIAQTQNCRATHVHVRSFNGTTVVVELDNVPARVSVRISHFMDGDAAPARAHGV